MCLRPLPLYSPCRQGWAGGGGGFNAEVKSVLRINIDFMPIRIQIRIRQSNLMLIQVLIRIRIGINTMPIHMPILLLVFTYWKIGANFTFVHSNASLQCFSFLISGKCVMILSILDSILKF
jgi:hypothetical protein